MLYYFRITGLKGYQPLPPIRGRMTRSTALQALLALLIFTLGSLQAWDSNVPVASLGGLIFTGILRREDSQA